MAEKSTLITQDEYNALSDKDKALYNPPEQWSRGVGGGRAMLKSEEEKLKAQKPATPTTELKSTDPKKTSDVTKVKNLNQLYDLQKKWPNGWFDEKTYDFHYNDKITEDRAKKAEEDKKLGRDYKNGEALSQAQLDKKTGDFNAKDINGNYVYSYQKLVEMRNEARKNGDKELEAKLQKIINERPEGKAEIAENRKKAEAAAKTEAKAAKTENADNADNGGGKSNGGESALKDTRAEDEALDKKQEALDKVLDKSKTRREELDEEWDKLLADNEAELDKHKDAAELANFLPRFAIQHYLEGNFGKRGSAKAIGTLGYFLLDKIGASLVNASQVARGMSPTQKTALEQYNSKMMDAAINRDDKNRSKINEEKVNNIIKNSDALRKAGFDTEITLGNDMASKYLAQHADQINEQVYLKLKKQAADWYDNLSDSEKMSVDRLFLAMSADPSERQKGILQYQLKGYEANAQEDTARAEKAKYEQAAAKARTKAAEKLTELQLKKAETEIENMKKAGLLTDAQTADAWKIVDIHQKDLNWKDANELQKQITGYLKPVTDAIDAVMRF